MKNPATRTDAANIALMLATLALSYTLPFGLLLLSYAVLGPLHYLTEISWLHDRSYFLPKRQWVWAGLAIVPVALMGNMTLAAISIWLVLGLFAALALGKRGLQKMAIIGITLAGVVALALFDAASFTLAVLIPTVIHVSLFTFIFMLSGALRARNATQLGIAALYLACLVLIYFMPPLAHWETPTIMERVDIYFGNIGRAFAGLTHDNFDVVSQRLSGFLSFIYTYHYLNWFIKADVIKWHNVPRPRLVKIGLLWLASVSLYVINYKAGFFVLLGLSFMHVVLEFPLNILSMHTLAGQIRRRPVVTQEQ